MTHSKQHGGYATQAKRRGETYCGCNTCGSRPWRQAQPWRMSRKDNVLEALNILLGVAVLLVWGVGLWLWASILAVAS